MGNLKTVGDNRRLIRRLPTFVGSSNMAAPIMDNVTESKGNIDSEKYSMLWRAFGKSDDIPALVKKVMKMSLEFEIGQSFPRNRVSLQGQAKLEEKRRRRSCYAALSTCEEKLQLFSAQQVSCRILGSKGYFCEHDFLRTNNTGKLLWQVFGTEATHLCIYGIKEQEDAMWNVFKMAGKYRVWYLYPNLTLVDCHGHKVLSSQDIAQLVNGKSMNKQQFVNFVMIDGTWNNSKAVVSRLQDHAQALWGGNQMDCIALSPERPSLMHNLRPQPSLYQACTAAAAAQLLRELDSQEELRGHDLDKSANALDNALQQLANALGIKHVARRPR